jgi:hypothetical protein
MPYAALVDLIEADFLGVDGAIRYLKVDADTGDEVEPDDIVKGWERRKKPIQLARGAMGYSGMDATEPGLAIVVILCTVNPLVFFMPEGIGGVVVAAPAAIEHQRHQSASDQQRKESAEAERNPAVLAHPNVAADAPCRDCPCHGREQ